MASRPDAELDDLPLALPPGARQVLLAPGGLVRALAAADDDPERQWMLRLPRAVRRSFVAEVIDAGAGRRGQERWLLSQSDEVCRSYADDVLARTPGGDPAEAWLLRQPLSVRASFIREVLTN
ncbi:MAG: hypothetical protein JHC95_06855 [Solirubrobacteraceae bacterium]|nr:hypothetical protein [Solirubrobacteraceae bacterium]